MSDFDAKRLRFVAQMLDQHDKDETEPPAELEMEFAKLSARLSAVQRPRRIRQREKEQEATKFLYRARFA